MTIAVGDKLPNATFKEKTADGPVDGSAPMIETSLSEDAFTLRIGRDALFSTPYLCLRQRPAVALEDAFSEVPYMILRLKGYVYDHRYEPAMKTDLTRRCKSEFARLGGLHRNTAFALELLFTYPFADSVVHAVGGDYTNLQLTLDVNMEELLAGLPALLEAVQVDREALREVHRSRLREVDLDLLGEELLRGNPVDIGEAHEPGDRDDPFSPLIGTQHRGLELLVRHCLDFMQRQALLPPDGPQSIPHPLRRDGHPIPPTSVFLPQPGCLQGYLANAQMSTLRGI